MTERESYERGAQLTYELVLGWAHREGPPVFAFPPRDVAVLADLRDIGAKLARNDSARELVTHLIDQVVEATGQAPTAMMLRVVLEEVGYPIQWVPLEELGLVKFAGRH